MINAVNMSDGLDGLAGGKAMITLLLLCVVATAAGRQEALMFKQVLIVALLAFLFINYRFLKRRPALAYLGDAGSTLIGFLLVWLLIDTTQGEDAMMAPVIALWLMAVPLMDTVALMVRRPLRGRSPFSPGRDHLHHLLLARGLDRHFTVALLYVLGLALGGVGLLGHFLQVLDSAMFFAFLALFALYLWLTRQHEAVAQASENRADIRAGTETGQH